MQATGQANVLLSWSVCVLLQCLQVLGASEKNVFLRARQVVKIKSRKKKKYINKERTWPLTGNIWNQESGDQNPLHYKINVNIYSLFSSSPFFFQKERKMVKMKINFYSIIDFIFIYHPNSKCSRTSQKKSFKQRRVCLVW